MNDNNMEKLIAELRGAIDKHTSWKLPLSPTEKAKNKVCEDVHKILSKYTPAAVPSKSERGSRLRESILSWAYELPSEEGAFGFDINTACLEWEERLDGILSNHPTPPDEIEPLKDCGYTLATCPYERCSGITMRKPEIEPLAICGEGHPCPEKIRRVFEEAEFEHLPELADRKGYRIAEISIDHNLIKRKWFICLQNGEVGGNWINMPIKADTYQAAEDKARAYLSSLPDVKEGK